VDIRHFALAAALALAPMAADAVTVGVVDSARQGKHNDAGLNFAQGHGAFTPVGASWSPVGEPTKLSNSTGKFQSPFNSNPLTATREYFSVYDAEVGPGHSPKTLTFASDRTSFSLLWGSIDTYNSLTFHEGAGGTGDSFTLGGAAAIAAVTAAGAPPKLVGDNKATATNSEIVALFTFMANGAKGVEAFRSVTFASSTAAFEFGLAPVPAPFGAALLVSAFGVAGAVSARRRRARPA
jgi:hypothetical protein